MGHFPPCHPVPSLVNGDDDTHVGFALSALSVSYPALLVTTHVHTQADTDTHTQSHRRAVLTVPPKGPDLPKASKLIYFSHKEGNGLPSHL